MPVNALGEIPSTTKPCKFCESAGRKLPRSAGGRWLNRGGRHRARKKNRPACNDRQKRELDQSRCKERRGPQTSQSGSEKFDHPENPQHNAKSAKAESHHAMLAKTRDLPLASSVVLSLQGLAFLFAPCLLPQAARWFRNRYSRLFARLPASSTAPTQRRT